MSATDELVQAGDLAYASILTPDQDKTGEFFASLLGWRFQVTNDEYQELDLVEANPQQSIFTQPGGQPDLFICFTVESMAEALERAARAGAKVEGEPAEEDGGLTCGVTSPSGLPTTFYEFLKPRISRPLPSGADHGDLVGAIIESSDPDAVLTFHEAVFGSGNVSTQDGFLYRTQPPVRVVHSDHRRVVPVYGVAELDKAAQKVTTLGGSIVDTSEHHWRSGLAARDPLGFNFVIQSLVD